MATRVEARGSRAFRKTCSASGPGSGRRRPDDRRGPQRQQATPPGNLSNVPLHMADLGHRELRPGVHPRPDRERAGDAQQIQRRPGRIDAGTSASATSAASRSPSAAPGPAVHAALHRVRAEDGETRDDAGHRSAAGASLAALLGDRPGRHGVRPGDQVGRSSTGSARRGAGPSGRRPTSWSCAPATTRGPSGASARTCRTAA